MHKDIYVGGNPRNYLEFTEIRSEINKLSHPTAPDVDFALIITLAQELFKKNGVDLQTACYFTFAKTKLEGLNGFNEGCELIAELITTNWQSLWPENDTARIDLLDWLNNRAGYDIRSYSFKISDIPLLIQLEQPLKQITETLTPLKLKKSPGVIELYAFVRNTRETLESRAAHQLKLQRQPTFVSEKESSFEEVQEENVQDEDSSTIILEKSRPEPINLNTPPQQFSINLPLAPTPIPRFKAWHGFLMGTVITCAIFLTFIHFHQQKQIVLMDPQFFSLIPQQEIIQQANLLQSDPFYFHQPNLQVYQQQLTEIINQSPLASRFYGDNLAVLITQLWPDSQKAAALRIKWLLHLANQRNENPLNPHYSQTQKRLATLIRQVNQADAKGQKLSNSQLKSSLNAIARQLNENMPIEELLRQQLEQPTESQAKQIEQRLQGLLSHYHALITNNNQLN